MLSNDLLKAKKLDDLLEDARMQIPLYSKEWTNFNPSDPAVTILEGISYSTIAQQTFIDIMPGDVQERMFELAGCSRQLCRSSRVLLSAENVEESLTLPSGQKFRVGSMVFETNRENHLSGSSIIGVFSNNGQKISNYTYVLDPDIPIRAMVFGTKPAEGMELYLICDGLEKAGEDVIFYFQLDEKIKRNSLEGAQSFTELQWQCYTKRGFVDLKVRDYTDGLLHSGEIRVKMPKQEPEIYDKLPTKGYCIRAVLKKPDYDIPPCVTAVSGFLFEVWQKDTQSICYTFPKQDVISVYSDILENRYWMVFAKEDDGYYHKYTEDTDNGLLGRHFSVERTGYGSYEFYFDKEKYGFGPGEFINAVKIIAYNDEVMTRYMIGTVYGYENQQMDLPMKNIIQESFSLIAERELENGEKIYDFIKPDSENEFDLNYHIDEAKGKIKIVDAGDYIGAALYMSGSATTEGEMGNIRAGAKFIPAEYSSNIIFSNPAEGTGGCLTESLSDVRKRFIRDVNDHFTAVEAADYERIVRKTPGLCIHKVKAVMDNSKNEVIIAVKPYGTVERPVMSELYREQIRKNLESRRLLSTKITLVDPVYVEVVCNGTIFVKPHYEGCREQIEALIRNHLDYVNSDHNFGDLMSFDELFHRIESLECVELIYDLSCTSKNGVLAPKHGMDILPQNNCLLVPGEIRLEFNTLD